MLNPAFYSALARSILAGDATVDSIAARMTTTLGKNWRWLKPLARRYVAAFGGLPRPRRRDIVEFLRSDDGLRRVAYKHGSELKVAQWIAEPSSMRPVGAALNWPVPKIETVGELAAWLKIGASDLEWFADLRRLGARPGGGRFEAPFGHYHYRILAKDSGNIRLIESPKTRLKELQRKILSEILERIPAHPAVHGFLKGHSIRSFAAPHVGRHVVLRMDLKDFFPSISNARVQAFFRTAGYPEEVADRLGAICTNAAARGLWKALGRGLDPPAMAEARALYAQRHLPQGAPTSPALANLCAYRVDCRLSRLAESTGADYTRYADDLAFSGEEAFERSVGRFVIRVSAILLEEGFHIQHRKTRIMRQGVRQYLAGLVVNERINVVRADYEQLKAILTNSVRYGIDSQNRERHLDFHAHLEGRVSFVEMVNPAKGARLRNILAEIPAEPLTMPETRDSTRQKS